MNSILDRTLASIVTENHEAASIFERYNLDFCCKGKRPLKEACIEKNIDAEQIAKELKALTEAGDEKQTPFEEMTEDQLIGHILLHHHFYVKQAMPTIVFHLEKVVAKHGDRHPEMVEVYNYFLELQQDFNGHLHKEEMILFPRIKEMAEAKSKGLVLPDASYIQGPVDVMEHEHDRAGEITSQIRQLTNNYTAPEGACTTFRVVIAELQAFELDLHKHVHLENNILFLKAEKLFLN